MSTKSIREREGKKQSTIIFVAKVFFYFSLGGTLLLAFFISLNVFIGMLVLFVFLSLYFTGGPRPAIFKKRKIPYAK